MWHRHLVNPKTKVSLDKLDTDSSEGFKGNKEEAEQRLKHLRAKLDHLQELLYAESKHKILIVLQAMDTGGKDGTIRCVFEGINTQGVEVARFNVPTPEELKHDFLWRVHKFAPASGMITIFNRSHYEDVVTVGVHNEINSEEIKKRYGHINDFERMLSDEGTIILKFFLHISKDEQKERLKERLDDSKKYWKFSEGDIEERKKWPNYTKAYEQAISATSTPWAPWCVVPANKKWYRNLVVAEAIVAHLEQLNMKYPKLTINPKTVHIK